MFYDNTYNINNNNTNLLHHHIHHQQNYNYFGGFPKVIDNAAYNYPVLAPSTTTLYHQQYDDMYSANMHSCPLINDYSTSYQYNTNTTSSRPIRRYKPLCTHTIDRSIGQYQKQYAGLNWKKITDNYDSKPQQHNYDTYDVKPSRSSTTTATKKKNKSTTTTFSTSSNSKQQQQQQKTNYDTYSKYTTHYDTMKVHKSRDTIKLNRIKTAVVEQQQIINNKSMSSELSRQTDNSCNSSSKSSEIQQQKQPVTVPQPPPPAPPLIKDLFKPIDNSFLFNRLKNKKLKKPILLADELATKSFDAVVDELKFKLEKMRTNNDHLSRLDTLLNKTTRATPQATGQSIIIKNNEPILPQQAATSSIYSTNFKINKKIEKTKSTSSVCSQSVKSDLLANNNNKLIEPLENCSSFNSTDSKKINSIKSDNNKCFKLEVYESNGEESDDYTKYTRLKFTPTPNKNETSKFIDEKINYTNIEEYDDNEEEEEEEEEKKQQLKRISQSNKQSAEFFTQNLFMTNRQTQSNKINQTYKNEFKEMPSGQFIKLVKTVISKSSHDKSFTSSLDLVNNTVNNEAKSDTSSSGIDSSNFLNSDDDLNNHNSNNNNKSVLTKTNSIENFLIPSKFSSFTDYNITKNKHLNEQKISKQDEIIPQLNNLNQYNKICEQISDYVSMQNNSYFSTEFELTNDDNQMLNKYLNEMTNYYQTLNNNNTNQELNN
jgi:hypothetical protein